MGKCVVSSLLIGSFFLLIVGTNLFTLRYSGGIKRRIDRIREWITRGFAKAVEPLSDEVGAWYAADGMIVFAHAGGGQCRSVYLNAEECIMHIIQRSNCALEVDVCFTADGVPVLTHNFEPDGELAFPEGKPTVVQFLKTKINGQWTPLTFEGFVEVIRGWSGVVFVDVKRGEVIRLAEWLRTSSIRAEVAQWIFQIGSEEEFVACKRAGLEVLHFNAPLPEAYRWIPWMKAHGVHTISIPHRSILTSKTLQPFRDAGIHTFAWTVNHKTDRQRVLQAGVKGYFTDWLLDEER